MCCCCPPAISALFCLWAKSGCRKSTVASTLTFFPPEPSLYKFERITKDGRVLEDDEDATSKEYRKVQSGEGAATEETGSIEESPTTHLPEAETKGQTQEQMKSPMEQLTEQAEERRKRSKVRKVRDEKDVAAGVTYRLALDNRLVLPPHDQNSIEAIKIPGHPKSDGALIATLIYRLPDSQVTENTKTIIYSHGNATDIGAMFPIQVILALSLKCHVVVYDYSGYGESGGVPDENNTYADIQTVYQYALEKVANKKPGNIILYGQSVGSGPCCFLASKEEQIGGMILHSPFTSGMRVLTPSRALACLDIYPNIDRVKHVNCPVMVIHGVLDQEVDISHGRDMHEAVPEEFRRDPWWVPDRGHNDITEGRGKLAEYLQRLRAFLRGLDE
mmetsp:Transcript_27053/g.56651  ORF Transcript_27053/g.56651 Transcript_27053/m.56651 type:complete len:389 (+) Transcript_27053:269-1435(+)|eukprot:CAMPEP_0172442706 /NCGR_PEP_ID=MMETSP1065-20121228/3097_1 /TAXON_ID=265537 /ORGANISM="Amphiprora paludosa, Strain CCMP125" /LENGTH=388 /DNA_ID=CAMNT_0013192687 /DNA_START=257 /DNA_END=1423 /DNA_ORIENTATION=+